MPGCYPVHVGPGRVLQPQEIHQSVGKETGAKSRIQTTLFGNFSLAESESWLTPTEGGCWCSWSLVVDSSLCGFRSLSLSWPVSMPKARLCGSAASACGAGLVWWGSRESRKAAHAAGDSALPCTASSIPPGSGNGEELLPGTCILPRSCTAGAWLSFLLLLSVRSWDCTAALDLRAALLPVCPCSYSRPSPNPPAASTGVLLKPVTC